MNKEKKSIKIMIAGIGGASLGTEIYKSLRMIDEYEIYGCDISETAYGLYETGFVKTYLINEKDYINSVIDACHNAGATWLIPGGEQPMILLGNAAARLSDANIKLLANTPDVIALYSDKEATFEKLLNSGISIPRTIAIHEVGDIDFVGLPCIVKPATGTGGSFSVFFAIDVEEAMIYAEFIRRNGSQPIAQEYVDIDEGEFTIGILSTPSQQIISTIALRRDLNAKLSLSYRGRGGVISSGYSQGYIDEYPDICRQAEHIAKTIGSRGPLNIQARVRNGQLYPFEINPRFSASTYLRALAGVNEVDLFLRYMNDGEFPDNLTISPGWYLRSLTENYIPKALQK